MGRWPTLRSLICLPLSLSPFLFECHPCSPLPGTTRTITRTGSVASGSVISLCSLFEDYCMQPSPVAWGGLLPPTVALSRTAMTRHGVHCLMCKISRAHFAFTPLTRAHTQQASVRERRPVQSLPPRQPRHRATTPTRRMGSVPLLDQFPSLSLAFFT